MLSMYHPDFMRGGISRISYEVGKALVKLGHEIYFPTLNPTGKRIADNSGMNIIEAKSGYGFYPRTLAHAMRFLTDNHHLLSNIDLIHSHSVATTASILYKKTGMLGSIPIVHGQYDTALTELSTTLQETASRVERTKNIAHYSIVKLCEIINLKFSDVIITEDFETRRKILELSSSFASKTHVIPSGADTNQFVSSPYADHEFKKRLGIPFDAIIVVYVGRIVPRKGLMTLMNAIVRVMGMKQNVFLVLAGRPETPFLRRLQDFSRELGISARVKFCLNVSEETLPSYYSIANLVVIPSLSEGIPITLFEAMSTGSPVIISDLPQIRKIEPSVTDAVGFFKPGSVNDLAQSIISAIYSKDKKQLSSKIRDVGLQFDWSVIAKRVASIYQDIIESRAAG